MASDFGERSLRRAIHKRGRRHRKNADFCVELHRNLRIVKNQLRQAEYVLSPGYRLKQTNARGVDLRKSYPTFCLAMLVAGRLRRVVWD